ncbi:MAG: hypothetical protein K0S53_876 [Bacteroidetes bacterium]|jgi:uncharacterized SAM-binding protein YcdF (DUF218 family)|nr:hypothetical protein [Bacteroidota bacterium]MDF2450782.1 hypothetical protein [Bacteroidota bacterium]
MKLYESYKSIRTFFFIGASCLLSIGFNSCGWYYNLFYTDPIACFETACDKKPYDAVIVPGYPHDSGKVNIVLEHRIKWAYYLYRNGYVKNIIFSGSAVYTPYIESEVMRLFALQLGVKNENIFIETNAEHTTENLYYSYLKAKDLGFKSIAFASESAQTSFMKPVKRKFKLDLDFIPIVDDSLKKMDIELKPIDESTAFVNNFVSIVKREGLLKRLRGTRGHKVKVAIRKAKRLKRQEK